MLKIEKTEKRQMKSKENREWLHWVVCSTEYLLGRIRISVKINEYSFVILSRNNKVRLMVENG